jgi:glycine dehydrogenase subunit 1
MRYIPHTEHDIQAMLAVLGVDSVEDLIRHLPEDLRQNASLDIAPGLAESEITQRLTTFAEQQVGYRPERSFLGAGAYAHLVPVVVDQIVQRAEFATAYTPYQPEVSQGTLQVIFEFQSLVSSLLGLEVANASMYDGASATAEAVLMAKRIAQTLASADRPLSASTIPPGH